MTVYTIGHSTLPINDFIGLLRKHGIMRLVDIRTVPRSRFNPQYEQDALIASLTEEGIAYVHFKALGGLRPAVKASVNTAWRNASFRNYADYMQSAAFEEGIVGLIALAGEMPCVIMCAEAVPWRCHRSLVADALMIRGVEVRHIIGEAAAKPHQLTAFAKVEGTTVTYPGEDMDG